MPLQHWRVLRTLHNPRYAGAFAYGRRRERRSRRRQDDHQTPAPRAVDRADPRRPPRLHHLGPVRDQPALLLANAAAHGADRAAGPAREGPALLQGLAICGRCGRRMTVRYHTRRGVAGPRLPLHDATASKTARPAARPSPAPASTPPSASCCSTPSPRSRSRSPSPCRPNSTARAAEADALRRQPRRTRPPPRRPGPPPLPGRRPRQPARRRQPRSRLERRAARPRRRPATTTNAPAPPPQPRSPTSDKARDRRAGHRLPRPLVRPRHPAARTQTHGPPAHRRRHPAPRPTHITSHVRFRGGQTTSLDRPDPARPPGKLRQTHPDDRRRPRPAPRRPHRRRDRRHPQHAGLQPAGERAGLHRLVIWSIRTGAPASSSPRDRLRAPRDCSRSPRSPTARRSTPDRQGLAAARPARLGRPVNDKGSAPLPVPPVVPRQARPAGRRAAPARRNSSNATNPRRCSVKSTPLSFGLPDAGRGRSGSRSARPAPRRPGSVLGRTGRLDPPRSAGCRCTSRRRHPPEERQRRHVRGHPRRAGPCCSTGRTNMCRRAGQHHHERPHPADPPGHRVHPPAQVARSRSAPPPPARTGGRGTVTARRRLRSRELRASSSGGSW